MTVFTVKRTAKLEMGISGFRTVASRLLAKATEQKSSNMRSPHVLPSLQSTIGRVKSRQNCCRSTLLCHTRVAQCLPNCCIIDASTSWKSSAVAAQRQGDLVLQACACRASGRIRQCVNCMHNLSNSGGVPDACLR